jgi:hypothetical protein
MTPATTSAPIVASPRLELLREPVTYRQHGEHSYFRDLWEAQTGAPGSMRRLERHKVEMRAHPSSNTSAFAPPVWLMDEAAVAPRPDGLAFVSKVRQVDLPAGHTVSTPAIQVGTTTAAVTDLTAPSDTDFTDAAESSMVTTIVGQSLQSQQLFDQGGGAQTDYAIWRDLTSSFNAQFEFQVLFGSGVGQNLLGIANAVPTTHQIAYTSGTPTPIGVLTAVAQAFGKVGDDRGQAPTLALLRSGRWAWLSIADAGSSPAAAALILAGISAGRPNLLGGLPAACDDAIPANQGTGSNQDAILLTRPDDCLILRGSLVTSAAVEPGSGSLQVLLTLRQSVALLNLWPAGHASVSGTGLTYPNGW